MERLTISVPEMAKKLGISRSIAYELVKSRNFPALRIGKRFIIPVAELEKWLSESASERIEVKLS